jgi:hypothetical protein
MAAAFRIVMARPGPYLAGRMEEFEIVLSPHLAGAEVAVQPTQTFIDSRRPQAWAAELEGSPRYGGWFPDVRRAIERYFQDALKTPLGALQWSIAPDLLILAVIIVLAPWRPGFSFAALLVFSRVPPLFLLMPDAQSKYFSAFEFCLPFLLAGLVAPALGRLSGRK